MDLRGFEPLISPVREVRKAFTATYSRARLSPSLQVTSDFSITSIPIEFRVFPDVMLGTCWEQIKQDDASLRVQTLTAATN